MKKYLYLALTFITSILLISVVKAEGPYYLDFETPIIENRLLSDALNVAYSKDRYITVDTVGNEGLVVTIYDNKGKSIKEKVFPEGTNINYIETLDNNIYMLIYENNEDKTYLVKYNEELVEQKRKEQEYGIDMFDIYTKPLRIVDNKVVVLYGIDIIVIDKDLINPRTYPVNEENLTKYAPDLLFTQGINPNTNNVYVFDYKDGYFAVGMEEYDDSCQVHDPTASPTQQQHGMGRMGNNMNFYFHPECYESKLILYDNEHNKVFEKTVKDHFTEVRLINNHIVTIASTKKGYNILIYDLKGNLIQTISNGKLFGDIEPTPKGFIVSQSTDTCVGSSTNNPIFSPSDQNTNNSQSDALALDPCKLNHQVYYLYNEIIPKVVSGKGKINVVSKQVPGEPVEFEIIPEDGYVLGEVKVTDALGNVIIIKDYKFTMPSADVTIEVTFVKADAVIPNAETTDIAITVFTLLAIITGGFTISFMRRLKFLK